ncbi:MAG: HAMP domain-containing sensor histidine kinase [Lachnospiraceae bacterium]|nr:HAMP domain-containing sensor histidine kinase [Lachnospiraceae bacterium]
MKLKTRLKVAFCAIILVPIILFAAAIFGFSQYQVKSIEKTYGISFSIESLSSSLQILSQSTEELCDKMRNTAETDPDQFLNFSYLQGLNDEMIQKSSYLLLRKGEELYYNGTEDTVTKLFSELPDYGDNDTASDGGTYIGKDVKSLVKQVDMIFRDGTKGTAFIITSASVVLPQMRSLLFDMLIAIIVILIFTASTMTLWIYAGINTPLTKLREATQRIKEGDLDFTLEPEGDDEISDLCRDFESMRQRLKESEEEKEKYDNENKELISNISHDLKTPITTVKGYVEGIMDGVADTPDKMDRYIKTIYNKANDMDRLINELTFYSKIDTNRIPYTFNKIDVADYFNDCAEEVSLDLEERDIEFIYYNRVDKNTVIIADAEQLKRVINNIIGNSIKYMDKSRGKIELRIRDAGDFIQVELEDNGKGIASKDLPAIFDRFYRTDTSRNSAQGGSGIGLSIVKKIIEDHGGRIWASSKIGRGTTMYFVIRKYQEVPV